MGSGMCHMYRCNLVLYSCILFCCLCFVFVLSIDIIRKIQDCLEQFPIIRCYARPHCV